jgi:hypothetical protein
MNTGANDAEMSTRIYNVSPLLSAITSYIQENKLVKFQYWLCLYIFVPVQVKVT